MGIFKGYILTRQRRDEGGKHHLIYGGIGSGEGHEGPFEVHITTHRPLFFVPRTATLSQQHHQERRRVALTNFSGEAVDALYFKTLSAFFRARKACEKKGIPTYESDIHPEERFLMERFIYGGVEISGPSKLQRGVRIYRDPEMRKGEIKPDFSLFSLDIETGQQGQLYSIAFHGTRKGGDLRHVLMVDKQASPPFLPEPLTEGTLTRFPTEKEVLTAFFEALHAFDPDILIGWHVIGFDLSFLQKKCAAHHVPFRLGRDNQPTEIREIRKGVYRVEARGRLVVDGPPTLRGAFYNFENFRLETVAKELLGSGKDISEEGDKVAEIERRYRDDKPALARYNLLDCTLVTEIFKKTDLINHLFTRSIISGLPMDRVGMSVAAFDFFMLPKIHRKGYVAANVKDIESAGHAAGGHVFAKEPGFYRHVVVLDFKSLYPSIIRTFHIDPLSRLKGEQHPDKAATTPNGIAFSKTEHLLPEAIERLMESRETAKKREDAHLSQAVKILMNSFYGVMGTPGCRFYHPHLPTAITGTGQWVLKTTREHLESLGYEVIYGDTDSVFVCLKEDEKSRAQDASLDLVERLNAFFTDLIKTRFGLTSRLELEFEKHFHHFFLPAIRGGGGSAKKRYAGTIEKDGESKLVITGLEFVRSDWTRFARDFQYELFERVFAQEEIPNWFKSKISDLKTGAFDDLLVYQKRITKPLSEYTKVIPPHVRAAQLLGDAAENLRESRYVMTLRGPIPLELPHDDLDYAHYIEKQVKPIFDSIMIFYDTSCHDILHGKQLDLFSS